MAGICTCLSNFLFVNAQTRWNKFLCDLTNFRKYGKPRNISQTIQRGNMLSVIALLSLISGTITYTILISGETPKCYELKASLKLDLLICGMFIPTWLPFVVSYNVSIALYIFQFVAVFLNAAASVMVTVLIWETISILTAHISHLNNQFREIVNEGSIRQRHRIRCWIAYHAHINK